MDEIKDQTIITTYHYLSSLNISFIYHLTYHSFITQHIIHLSIIKPFTYHSPHIIHLLLNISFIYHIIHLSLIITIHLSLIILIIIYTFQPFKTFHMLSQLNSHAHSSTFLQRTSHMHFHLPTSSFHHLLHLYSTCIYHNSPQLPPFTHTCTYSFIIEPPIQHMHSHTL